MSVTFTPAAATVTTYDYYDGNGDELDPNCKNGILRIAYENPSINYANARAARLMAMCSFGSMLVHEDGSRERVLWGRLPAHRCKEMIARLFDLQLSSEIWEEYKLHEFVQVLRHCQFHDCDLIYS